ncbi:dicarboxylate/amino acid:cation symporter [Mucilaginibacter gossypii]|uniref:dicarboxylate/amino acid:cation symporter n=1 Tax=Mucilaginibacter gossypii TaxID=551996 RepID=UPI000DCDF9A5|nr:MULTISPECIES: dicarboxylate/amino acid:cation symporter [Mucilaginibacter]QTE38113.1 dicarboxylate/amino acid:cation symporter [Mucilaginibacter gossypii]RAV58572.1 dicarboxylate/amino acid:cation symporter [Mucilaginibacter rubeus]
MKKSRLTLFIFIALVLGVIAGYIYNTYVFADLNKQLSTAGTAIKAIDKNIEALSDTTVAAYKDLKLQRITQAKLQSQATDAREDKLELYNILSKIFLNLIKMIVAPLVFTTLVVGVAKVGDIKAVGRIGGKTMLWFISATLVSLLLGMLLVNLFEPGKTMHLPLPDSHLSTGIKKSALSLTEFVGHVFPKSFIEAMANNEILQIVVFSLFFGVATAAIGEQGKIVIKAMDAFAHVIMKITGYVMKMAPLAVFGAITAVVAKQGIGVLSTYGIFISEFYFSLIVLWSVIILAGYIVLRKPVFRLINRIKDAMLIAFSTSTSEAAYPKVLEELEKFGCSNKIVSFVLPLGYSFNLDGSMMYMTFASLFLAQSYDIHLSFGHQLSMLLVLMLTSKGVAGVPRASLVVIAGTLAMFNIPEAGLFLLIGIDPLLDMGRSATNVLGNAMATAVVSKWEGEGIN